MYLKQKKWTEKEDQFIKENYKVMSHSEMGIFLKRSDLSVRSRCHVLKLIGFKSFPVEIGEVFGRWTVIEKSGIKNHGQSYLCQCSCGNTSKVRGAKLRDGTSQSCGCYRIEKGKEVARLEIGECSYNYLEDACKRAAKKRDLVYELSMKDFRYLISQDCYWCGTAPKLWNFYYKEDGTRTGVGGKSKGKVSEEWAEKQWVLKNGIDRVNNDPSIGYILGNCVPCCSYCNSIKMDKTVEEFLTQIAKIHDKHKNRTQKSA